MLSAVDAKDLHSASIVPFAGAPGTRAAPMGFAVLLIAGATCIKFK